MRELLTAGLAFVALSSTFEGLTRSAGEIRPTVTRL
jgi:hypothetical protein